MAINNHSCTDNIRELVDIKLLSQRFDSVLQPCLSLDDAKQIAESYTRLENAISVLSDMKSRKSYIFCGGIAEHLGFEPGQAEINSIWEDDLLSRVHSEDLQKKYRLEFQFFQLLKSISINERPDYNVITRLRMRNREGKYCVIKHRLFYLSSSADGSIWLALCLYNLVFDYPGFDVPDGVIINMRTGEILGSSHQGFDEILSERERQILQLIKLGKRSKEIANILSLSIHTVNRHRQNIFQKLNVSNALEACRIADATGLL